MQPATNSLRPYQREAIDALAEGFRTWQRLVLMLPTGTGKTFTAASFIHEHFLSRGKTALWIAHSKELLDQACETFISLGLSPERIGRHYATNRKDLGRKPDAQLWVLNNLTRVRPCEKVDCIIFDEAHHADGESYKRWLVDYGVSEEDGPKVLGLTATPYRRFGGEILPLTSDAFSFGARPRLPVFEAVAYEKSFAQLAAEAYLAPFKHIPVETQLRFQLDWDQQLRDFRQASLQQLDTPSRNDFIHDLWRRNRDRFGKTLIFVGTCEHAKRLASVFGRDGGYMVGSMDNDEREAVMRDFRDGDMRVLVNVGIFREGVDVPNIRTVILARPTASPMLFTQMVGRGARLCPRTGKKFFYLVDVHDQLGIYDGYLMGVNDLQDDDPDTRQLIEARAEAAELEEMQRLAELAGEFDSASRRSAEDDEEKKKRRRPPRDAETVQAMLDMSAGEVNDFCGWVCFEDAEGKPTNLAMFLTRADVEKFEAVQDETGALPPEAAEKLKAAGEPSVAVARAIAALERGLKGRAQRFPEEPSLREEIESLARSLARRHDPFKGKVLARADQLGLGADIASEVLRRFEQSPASFGGAVSIEEGETRKLLLVNPAAVGCLRRAMEAKLSRAYDLDFVLDRIDEATRLEPGLARHRRQIARMIDGAESFADICVEAAA